MRFGIIVIMSSIFIACNPRVIDDCGRDRVCGEATAFLNSDFTEFTVEFIELEEISDHWMFLNFEIGEISYFLHLRNIKLTTDTMSILRFHEAQENETINGLLQTCNSRGMVAYDLDTTDAVVDYLVFEEIDTLNNTFRGNFQASFTFNPITNSMDNEPPVVNFMNGQFETSFCP